MGSPPPTITAAAIRVPLVAIYPKEGTFWSDHPAGIVDRIIPEYAGLMQKGDAEVVTQVSMND